MHNYMYQKKYPESNLFHKKGNGDAKCGIEEKKELFIVSVCYMYM